MLLCSSIYSQLRQCEERKDGIGARAPNFSKFVFGALLVMSMLERLPDAKPTETTGA